MTVFLVTLCVVANVAESYGWVEAGQSHTAGRSKKTRRAVEKKEEPKL